MINDDAFLELLLNQLAAVDGDVLKVGVDDYADVSDSMWSTFVDLGILQKASPALRIGCDGCEERCPSMPVHRISASDLSPARAFIVCESRDDIGRVPVDFERLNQWQVSMRQLAQVVAGLCGFTQPAVMDAGRWRLGTIQGNQHNEQAYLCCEDGEVFIALAGQRATLLTLLKFNDKGLLIDLKRLKKMADSPTGLSDTVETTEARGVRILARQRELKDRKVKSFNQTIADEEGLGLTMVKNIIKAAKEREKTQKSNPYAQIANISSAQSKK